MTPPDGAAAEVPAGPQLVPPDAARDAAVEKELCVAAAPDEPTTTTAPAIAAAHGEAPAPDAWWRTRQRRWTSRCRPSPLSDRQRWPD